MDFDFLNKDSFKPIKIKTLKWKSVTCPRCNGTGRAPSLPYWSCNCSGYKYSLGIHSHSDKLIKDASCPIGWHYCYCKDKCEQGPRKHRYSMVCSRCSGTGTIQELVYE